MVCIFRWNVELFNPLLGKVPSGDNTSIRPRSAHRKRCCLLLTGPEKQTGLYAWELNVLLEECAYPEVDAYLKNKDALLIPVGAVEQHSPYGLIGTDCMAAEAVARAAGNRLQLMVAPVLPYGVSPHHMGFPGTATLQPTTMLAVCCDLIRSFTSHGFRRIFFINGHGGNRHVLHAALQQCKMENQEGIFEVFSWYECTGVKRFNTRCFQRKEGRHATPSEISLTMHLRPGAFAGKATHPQPVTQQQTYWPMTAEEMKQTYPDGRMDSAPWLANGETGKAILEAAVEGLCKKLHPYLEMKQVSTR